MYTFLIASVFIIIGCLSLSTAARAETNAVPYISPSEDVQTVSMSENTVASEDYHFQSWNCLTDF